MIYKHNLRTFERWDDTRLFSVPMNRTEHWFGQSGKAALQRTIYYPHHLLLSGRKLEERSMPRLSRHRLFTFSLQDQIQLRIFWKLRDQRRRLRQHSLIDEVGDESNFHHDQLVDDRDENQISTEYPSEDEMKIDSIRQSYTDGDGGSTSISRRDVMLNSVPERFCTEEVLNLITDSTKNVGSR